MREIPQDIDLSFLEQKELMQVAVGLHQTILHFTDQVSILIEGTCRYRDQTGREIDCRDSKTSAMILVPLLGHVLTQVAKKDKKGLKLFFDEGQVIELDSDSEQFESYQIKRGDQWVLIV